MLVELLTTMPTTALGCLLAFVLWFLIWAPLVALLEYFAHRWIMHKANRLLDPKLGQLKAHGAHHMGSNDHELVDMPLKNCLLLTSPAFVALVAWGLAFGSMSSIVVPLATLLSWSFFYTYLWTRVHRAIHGLEVNWFSHLGPVFRFFRDHHLTHHSNARMNYGTVFPWTDYVFLTSRDRRKKGARSQKATVPHDSAL